MIKPIKPHDVAKLKEERLPDQVILAFNEAIADNWKGTYASFRQDDIADRIKLKMGINDSTIFDKCYLNVEDIYRAAGWKVEFDSPAYCETYPAIFKFSK
jgi:hypothetical protein